MKRVLLVLAAARAHNWMHKPSGRAGGRALTSIPAKPSVRQPSLQVAAGQEFALEWMSGHPNEPYYWVVLHADDEARLAEHTTAMLDDYLESAPDGADAPYAGATFERYHVSCSANYPSGTNDCDGCKNCGQRDGSPNGGPDAHDGYAGVLSEDDPLFITLPDDPFASEKDGERGLAHFTYTAESRARDKRVSYASAAYPWIEAVHRFDSSVKFAQEWDIARFSLPATRGPGEYLIHMFWKSGAYHDVLDVDVIATESADVYGTEADEPRWLKVSARARARHLSRGRKL